MKNMSRIKQWRPITPLDHSIEEVVRGDLAAVDTLHRSWQEFTVDLDEADRYALRRRTLRKHAIETGIIEQLYEIDWGVTQQLVAQGLTNEVIARSRSDLSQEVIAMLQAQLEGLEMVTDYVRSDYPLTTSFIKELHALITRAQIDYAATDSLGGWCETPARPDGDDKLPGQRTEGRLDPPFLSTLLGRRVRTRLNHGSFKTLPNNVKLPDGSLMEFAPPEQVVGEIDRLVDWYNSMDTVHPVVSAAWLHHRFVQIHPFQDGNGRVARALTLLSLLRGKYPPLVVDRDSRNRYLQALDQANGGDLTRLCRLFAKLTMRSIRRELTSPVPAPIPQTAREVARAFARSLERKDRNEEALKVKAVRLRANQLHSTIKDWFGKALDDLREDFVVEGRKVWMWVDETTPDEPPRRDDAIAPSKWFHDQIIETAKRAEHFAVMWADRWWNLLGMTVNGHRLRLVVSIHHVGSLRTGVMAITSFGDIRVLDEEASARSDVFVPTSWDAFTFSHDEEVEDRAGELYDWLDHSLAVALRQLMRRTVALVSTSSGHYTADEGRL